MERAGHKCVGFCEIDKYARESYKAIHNTEGEWEAHDITRITDEEFYSFNGAVDVICGGFPCQAFSIAGKRGGFSDIRGTMFFHIARAVEQIQPRFLFLENVKGLLSHDKGKTFTTILTTLDELGYDAEWQVCNSKNFGVPQNRERVFIIGHLRGECGGEVFPITADNGQADELQGQQGECIANCLTARYEGAQATGTYVVEREQYAQEIKQVNNPVHSNDRVYDCAGISPTLNTMQGGRRQPKILCVDDTQGFDGVRFYEDETPAIRSQRSGLKIFDGYRIRRLTPLECFRLQGFPDECFYKAKEVGVSESQLYKQAGNSVTVDVIYEIARRLEDG